MDSPVKGRVSFERGAGWGENGREAKHNQGTVQLKAGFHFIPKKKKKLKIETIQKNRQP